MRSREILLGIVAIGGIVLLGFFSPPVFSPEGKLILVPIQSAQVGSSLDDIKKNIESEKSSVNIKNSNECLNGTVRDFSGNRKSVHRSVDSEQYCSDVEVNSVLVDSSLSVVDRLVTYRTTVTNHGPHTAQSIHIKGNVPKNFTASSWSGDMVMGSYALGKDDYFIKNLKPGQTTFIDLVVEVSPVACGLVHDNTAFVEAFAGADYNTTNNTDKERLLVPICDKWEKIYSI